MCDHTDVERCVLVIPPAKKSLVAGIVVLLGGAIVVAYGTDAYLWLTDVSGATAETGLHAISLVLNILRLTLMPLGAALVGAAVVIQSVATLLTVKEPAP